MTVGNEWLGSGLGFSFDAAARSVAVEGTPSLAGTYNLRVDVTVGGTRIADASLPLRIDPGDGTPGVGNIVVVPSTAEPFVVNRPADVSYTVASGIEDAVVVLRSVAGGSGNTFAVYGTPRVAGSQVLLLDVEIDGTLIPGYELLVTVAAAPPSDADVVFSPPLPDARVYRPYRATTTVGSRTGDAVVLNGATGSINWDISGLSFSLSGEAITISGGCSSGALLLAVFPALAALRRKSFLG